MSAFIRGQSYKDVNSRGRSKYIDDDYKWKTTWSRDRNPRGSLATGASFKRLEWDQGDSDYWEPNNALHREFIDLDAYWKDPDYRKAGEELGFSRYDTVDQIRQAQEWHWGGGREAAQPDPGSGFDTSGLESSIEELRSNLGGKAGTADLKTLRRQLQEQIDDLTDRGVEVGQVEGLQAQLTKLGQQAATGDQNIQNLLDRYQTATTQQLGDLEVGIGDFERRQWEKFQGIERDYMKTSDYEQSMADNLKALQQTMQGKWGRDIEQLDIEGIRSAISGAQGDLTSLTSNFAGLGADLRLGAQHSESERALLRQQLESDKTLSAAQRDTLRQQIGHLEGDVQRQYTDLSDRLSSGLSGLEGTFEGQIGDVRTALGEGLSDLTGQQADLSEDLSGVKTALGDYQSSTQDEFLGLKDRMTRQADITDQAIQDVHQTREQRLGDLTNEWGQNLRDQERQMTAQIDEGQQRINDRLTNLVSSMNYRTLGNTALGIKARRSKAYTSGASSRGTSQLGRTARLNTLNIA